MKRRGQKSELEAWQKEDAARLRTLLNAAKRQPTWRGIAAFSEECVGKSGSFLSQLASGYRPLNLTHAIRLAKGLGVTVADISPTLAAEIAEAATTKPSESSSPTTHRNRRASEFDRSVFRALETLEPEVQMSIKNMILALATAKNPDYLAWSSGIEEFNHKRDAGRPPAKKQKARA